ncbi:nucleotidyltransferase domain-containing protein [Rheinheimera sp. NSM]|uniref:nucleotidyltransferase domain-containing protein n=1 Tax=Rheinheimera sp. NSM TaxID=3457884 RepID=UPI0040353D26
MLNLPLLTFFRAPEQFVLQATAEDWTIFLQQAREQGLTARFYYLLQQRQLLDEVPKKVRLHGLSAARYAEKQHHSLFFELKQLEALFAGAEFPCLLLKGAAYRALALPVSHGRLFSDIDLLVPRQQLKAVRDKLFFYGFREGELSDYDRHFYLQWSHQNPPLQHYQRGSVIDLHHHIFPTASAKQINIAPLFEYASNISGSVFKVPTIAHLFIHAAVHLFYQEETHKLVKDIIDLNDLLLEVQHQDQLSFMLQQAAVMQVEPAVVNACYLLRTLFANTAAEEITSALPANAAQPLACRLVLWMLPDAGVKAWLARQAWFVRGHSLKMRWHILLYHTVAKPAAAMRRWFSRWRLNSGS